MNNILGQVCPGFSILPLKRLFAVYLKFKLTGYPVLFSVPLLNLATLSGGMGKLLLLLGSAIVTSQGS